MEYLFAFATTHKALKAERLLKEADMEFRLLPAPKYITVRCALVISIPSETMEESRIMLEDGGAPVVNLFKKVGEEYVEA